MKPYVVHYMSKNKIISVYILHSALTQLRWFRFNMAFMQPITAPYIGDRVIVLAPLAVVHYTPNK